MYNLIKELLIKILKTISKTGNIIKINAETLYDGKGFKGVILQIELVIILDNIFRINKLKEVGKRGYGTKDKEK